MTAAQAVGTVILAVSAVLAPLVDRHLRTREPLTVCLECGHVKYRRGPCPTCRVFADHKADR